MKLKFLAVLMTMVFVSFCLPDLTLLAGPMHEYAVDNMSGELDSATSHQELGRKELITEQSDILYSYLAYPSLGIDNVDKYISGWADEVYKNAKSSMKTPLIRTSLALSGEINADYSSYLLGGRYAGIEIMGYFKDRSSKSVDIVKTFNVSIDGKRILSNEEIISQKYIEQVLELLADEILKSDATYSSYIGNMDESWLENIVLVHEGVKVILEKGKFLPQETGTQCFTLRYYQLGDAFKLPKQYFSGIAPIDPNKPMLALTFDDGPGAASEKVLDILKKYNARATFCVLGNLVGKNEQVIKRAASEGSEIIGHSWDHKQLTRLNYASIKKQLEDTNKVISNITGITPKFHRPPYGSVNSNVVAASKTLGMAMLNWSVDTNDWKTKNADAIYNHIMENAADGSVILCHDIHPSTGEAMEKVIPELIKRGYQLVTVSELFNSSEIEPGKLYRSR